MAMVRNSAIIGSCSRSDLTNCIFFSCSVDREFPAAELAAHPLGELRGGRLGALQRVVDAELLPLALAELVEAQDLHALEALQAGAEIGDALHVVVPVGEARHQDEPHPHGAAQVREAAGVV